MSTKRIVSPGLLLVMLAVVMGLFSARPSRAMPTSQANLPSDGIVQRNANLRAGPGTTYAVVGNVKQGEIVDIAGCNTICDWHQLADGKWIAASLVELVAEQTVTSEEPITVVGWNTELNGADVKVIAERIAAFQDVDLWGLVEINRASYTQTLELAAEEGENADYASVLGASGGGDRILAIYDTTRFTLVDAWEIKEINTTGDARAPLVLQLQETGSGEELLFMVNHLYRTRNEERYQQARLLNQWAAAQTLPVIAVGDYNFDWDVTGEEHDTGYNLMTNGGAFTWVKPETLVTTQCSGWPCQFNSVLDFVFVAGPAQQWRAESAIIVVDGDFPDNAATSDHRPVMAQLWPSAEVVSTLATAVPTATVAPVTATTKSNANLRAGPGTTYAITGSAKQGQSLLIVGRNQTGDWYNLDSGAWIAASLVNHAPAAATLTVVTSQTTTTAPAQPTATPAAAQPTATTGATQPTPVPAQPTATPVSAQPTATPVPVQPTAVPASSQVSVSIEIRENASRSEIIGIRNNGAATIDISGWVFSGSKGDDSCTIPGGSLLQPGQTYEVATGDSQPGAPGYKCGDKPIWNNEGETIFLKTTDGQVFQLKT